MTGAVADRPRRVYRPRSEPPFCAVPGCPERVGPSANGGRWLKRCAGHTQGGGAKPGPREWAESELNRRTTAAYRACLASGGHSPSGERLVRPPWGGMTGPTAGADRALDVCARCAVPYAPGERTGR